MKARNGLLLLAVVLISALPLWFYQPADGEAAFAGSDDKAQQQISQLAPNYQPWFKPLLTPASPEIASLLFALQAALGAGVIGYWLGCAVTRQRLKAEFAENHPDFAVDRKNGEKADQPDAD